MAEIDRLYRAGDHSQTAIAKLVGTSQAAVSKALAALRYVPPVSAPRVLAPVPVKPVAGPPAVSALAADLERRIAELDSTAAEARKAGSYTPSVTAQAAAARLRRELEEVRQAEAERPAVVRDPDSDAALIERLVAVVEILPDEAYEQLEDAVARRRGRLRVVS